MRNKFDAKHIQSICKHGTNSNTVPYMDAQTALNELCRYFLGSDWYAEPGLTHPENINVSIVCAIEKKYKGAKLKRKVIYE